MLPARVRPRCGLRVSLRLAGFSLALALPFTGPAGAEPSQPSLTKPYQQRSLQTARATSAMARCLATWDRSSQMSRREWKETCKRVVKTNPALYNKSF